MAQLTRSQIMLSNGKEIVIIHNLERLDKDLDLMVRKWLLLTKDTSAESLCKFLSEDHPHNLALTEDNYNKLKERLG